MLIHRSQSKLRRRMTQQQSYRHVVPENTFVKNDTAFSGLLCVWNCWDIGLWPSAGILNNTEERVSETGFVSALGWGSGRHSPSHLRLETDPVSERERCSGDEIWSDTCKGIVSGTSRHVMWQKVASILEQAVWENEYSCKEILKETMDVNRPVRD
jgi:hypothetical protein